MKIISGNSLAEQIKVTLLRDITELTKTHHRPPKLALILAGDDANSQRYVHNKRLACERVGIVPTFFPLPKTVSEAEILSLIDTLNNADDVDGILVQLPLPEQVSQQNVIEAIAPTKDVDGFHPMNVGRLNSSKSGNAGGILPCTPKGIISLLKSEKIEIAGKHAVVIGRSNLVGKPMAQLLLRENASVTICHSHTCDLASFVKQAEILIIAIGKPNLIKAEMLQPGVVVIDVGINNLGGKLVGDLYNSFDLSEIEKVASAITPVPGGVGPMTIVSLLENTFEIYKKRLNI